MKGWRARIGIMIPSVNAVLEAEFSTICAEGITFHYSRMPISKGDPLSRLSGMRNSISQCLTSLETVADVVGFACTSGSFAVGFENEISLQKEMQDMVKKPVITTAQASMHALKQLNAHKIEVVTPYGQEVNSKLKEYMESWGYAVKINALDSSNFKSIGDFPEEQLYRQIRALPITEEMDALFISCTNLATWEILQQLENDLKKPVITANQATLWELLRTASCKDKIEGLGTLLNSY